MSGKDNVKTVNIKVEPVFLTKHLLQLYIEKNIEGKINIGRQYALYEFILKTMTYENFVKVINKYIEKFEIDTLTFEEWEDDCKGILSIIEETEDFKKVMARFSDMKL